MQIASRKFCAFCKVKKVLSRKFCFLSEVDWFDRQIVCRTKRLQAVLVTFSVRYTINQTKKQLQKWKKDSKFGTVNN